MGSNTCLAPEGVMRLWTACPPDAREMLGICGQFIGTPITFEPELPSPEEFIGRIASTQAEYPWIVCIGDSGKVAGYAYAHRLMGRRAYRWSAELSVYADRGHRGNGIAYALYSALLDILRLQNVVNAFACVTVPNPSESFRRPMGFREVGRFRQAGYEAGGWHDVAWYEMELSWHAGDPAEITLFPDLGPDAADGCLRRAESNAGKARREP